MIKLTNSVLIGLISASLIVGCGGGSDNDDIKGSNETATTEVSDTPSAPSSSASTFGANVMPILVLRCQSCHGQNGNFTVTTASMTHANIMALPGGATYMLNKGNGDIMHVGNDALDDTQYTTVKSWIDAGAMNN